MADNTPQNGTANIAADDITTMNGGTITAGTALAQRMKIGFGADSFFRDVEPLFPLPVYDPDTLASGTIAALNAVVSINLNADSAMRVQITGTWVGTLQFEATVDGTNWIAINGVQAGSTIIPQNTTGNGVFSPTPSGFASFRVNATAWTSGTATVSIRTSSGAGGFYLNQYLPAFSVIPAFKIDQTIPGTTNLVAIGAGANIIGDVNARQFAASADTTLQNAAVAVGNGTVLPATGYGTALIQIAGTFIGTVTFEATLDGTNYFPISAVQAGTSTIATTATVPGIYRLVAVGLTNIRARISAYTSGSITALGRTTNAPFAGKVITLSAASAVAINAALPTGANIIGGITAAQLPASLGAKAGSASMSLVPATDAYALLPATSTSLLLTATATTNATSVKASAGALKGIQGVNLKTSAVYLKLYNKAAAPTVGTDIPVKTIYLPASAAFVFDFTEGYVFSAGIAYALTLAAANADATALIAGDIVALNVDYL